MSKQTLQYDIAELEGVVRELLKKNARMATLFLDSKNVIRVTRTVFKNRFSPGNLSLTVTIGKPNYEEREYMAKMKKEKQDIYGELWFKFLKAKR